MLAWVLAAVLGAALATEVEAPRVTLALGQEYRAQLRFAEAAEAFERVARIAPAEDGAREALVDAIDLRIGLAQIDEARADLELFAKLYGTKHPEQAAALHMFGWQFARDDAERLKLVLAYLQRHAKHGGVDGVVVAEVEAGKLLWAQACTARVDGPPGLCVSGWTPPPVKAQARPPMTVKQGRAQVCAAGSAWTFTVHRRDARLAAAAQERFKRALQAGRRGAPEDPQRAAALREALATAELHVADQALETLMAAKVPHGLVVLRRGEATAAERDRERAALQKFEKFYRALVADGQAVERRYVAVLEARVPRPTIAASGRAAALSRTMVAKLFAVAVPQAASEAVAGAFCAEMTRVTGTLASRVREALEFCVGRATMLGEFTPAARVCEAELQRRAPREHPPLTEIVPTIGLAAWEPEHAPVELAMPEAGVSGELVAPAGE